MSFASPRPILAEPAWAVPPRPAANALLLQTASETRGLRLLPIGGFVWSGPHDTPRTRSDHVLIWMTAGTATLRLPRSAKAVSGVLFLPAGTAFALQPSPGAEGGVLLLNRDLAERAARPFPSAVVEAEGGAEDAGTRSAIAALAAEAQRPQPPGRGDLDACLGQVALALTRMADACHPREARDSLAERFVALAARELPHGRTLEDIAAMLGCTADALDAACLARHGKTAPALFAGLRLGRAVDLLAATDRPLPGIARETGFSDVDDLRRAVLAATGTQPEALRPR